MSEEKQKLGRDVYVALAAIGWADGHPRPRRGRCHRADGDRGGARPRSEIEEIEAATKSPVDIGEIDRRNLSKEDRLFVYAVASWMTWLDGDVTESEQTALAKLGDALKIPAEPREHADAIMREVAHLTEDIRPARFDVVRLRELIESGCAKRSVSAPADA